MRQIEPKMVKFLDAKLSSNGLAQHAIEAKDARLIFGLAAEACIGIKESGHNQGPMIELIQETIGGADREPYCMAFVQTCLAYAELKTGVQSPVFASEHCLTVWNKTPEIQRVKMSPLKYAIVIWRHGDTTSGHTGLVLEAYPMQWFRTVEANTNSDGAREGDGIYYKKRNWVRNGDLVKVGFLKPF